MNRELQRRAFQLFDEVCDLPADERERVLNEQCEGDEELLRAVLALVRSDATEASELPPGEGAELLAATIPPADESSPPLRIGRYRVLRELGRGGMGIVYEAEQDEPRRRVAVKVIREGVASREVVRRFQREAQLLGRLQDPGIAQVYEAGTDSQGGVARSYFAMEFIDGLPIDRHADARELGVSQRVELVARVCDAVQHAHQKGILHRDLKAANVLVASARDDESSDHGSKLDVIGQPKIVDFGIARLTDDTDGFTRQTHAGQIIGSVATMSPEQLEGRHEQVDTRTDVYSIGALLYRLLSGKSPHDLKGASIAEAARIVTERDPTSLGSIDSRLRGDLSVITAKALQRDLERRYESAAALGEDLRRVLREEPIAARPDEAWYRIKKYARRHRAAVTAAVVTVLLLIASTVVSTWFGLNATTARRLADRAAYRAEISAAAAAIRDGDSRLAREFLERADTERRGWEWYHLKSELDGSIEVAELGNPWDATTAKFLLARSWVSSPANRLYLPTVDTYMNTALEILEVSSLESLGAWELLRYEYPIGIVESEEQLWLVDTKAKELVVRNLLDGSEVSRKPTDPNSKGTARYIGPLPTDANQRQVVVAAILDVHQHGVLAISPNFDRAIRTRFRNNAPMWSLMESEVAFDLPVSREGTSNLAFSPDGIRIAIGSYDRRLAVRDARTGELLWEDDDTHKDALLGITFSPDGSLVATGSQDRVIRFWDAKTGELLGRAIGHNGAVSGLAFDATGETLFSTSGSTVRRWDVGDALRGGVLLRHSWFVNTLQLTEDGKTLVSRVAPANNRDAPTREIMAYDLEREEAHGPLQVPDVADVYHESWILRNDRLGVVSSRKVDEVESFHLHLFALPAGEFLFSADLGDTLSGPLTVLENRAVFAGLPHLAVDLDRHEVTRFEGPVAMEPHLDRWGFRWVDENLNTVHEFETPGAPIRSTAVDRERGLAYAGAKNGRVLVLDIRTGSVVGELEAASESIETLALLPDGSRVFGGSGDTTIRIWDTDTYELVGVLRGHGDTVRSLVVSPDGATLYSSSDDYTVRRWCTKGLGHSGVTEIRGSKR